MNGSWATATLLLVGVLAGCSFAPTYKAPPTVAPPAAAFQELGDWKKAEPMDALARGAWWSIFQDPQLDALEVKAGDANQNIQAAFARLQQARAETRIQRAGLFPSLNLDSAATRNRASPNSPSFPKGIVNPTYGNFDLEADFSYEIDLWGRGAQFGQLRQGKPAGERGRPRHAGSVHPCRGGPGLFQFAG